MSGINSRPEQPVEPIDIVNAKPEVDQVSFVDVLVGSKDELSIDKNKALPLDKMEIESKFSKLIPESTSAENSKSLTAEQILAQSRPASKFDPTSVMGTGGGGGSYRTETGRIVKPMPEPVKQVPYVPPKQPWTQPSHPQHPPDKTPVRNPKK